MNARRSLARTLSLTCQEFDGRGRRLKFSGMSLVPVALVWHRTSCHGVTLGIVHVPRVSDVPAL